jgi:hypothetical protein
VGLHDLRNGQEQNHLPLPTSTRLTARKETIQRLMACSRGTIARPHPLKAGVFQYLRPDCKRLTCPHCGPRQAKKYLEAIAKRAEENKLTRCLTLTLDPAKLPPGTNSVQYIRECWNKFRVYLSREFYRPVQFICVLEFQKNGNAHFHILIDRFIDQKWVSVQWQAVGGGKIVDIRCVDVHRVKNYLTKYLTKDLMALCPKHRRRITTSRAIRLFDPRKPSDWRFYKVSFWVWECWAGHSAQQLELDAQGTCFFEAPLSPEKDGPWDNDPGVT